ncbi:hypothetical protein [Allosalinactinospora lopnorensis]|uniref:hypothetical protein n=1 Tax=Allosalinactinospora lopnorensis TaxID=1352348 RepID=UPI000A853FA7|nr:hypothetical protein [Allosalinactinospora lopnorensis]
MTDSGDSPSGAQASGAGPSARAADDSAGGRGSGWARTVSEAVARGLREPLVLVGGLLIVASLALKIYVLRDAYFIEDDFLFVGNAASSDLTWDYLTDLHKGHLMPGAMFLAYAQTALSPYNWPLTAGVMLAFQAGASAAVFRLFWVVFGRRWAILSPLAVYLFAPLTLPVLAWWSAALNAVPFQMAIALALLWTAQYLRTGDSRYGWMTAGAVVLGMAFSVKAMFLPPLLFAVAAAFLVPGRFPHTIRRTFERDLPFWVGMAALSLGHGLLYLMREESAAGEGAGAPEADTAVTMTRRLLGETFPAGAVGGPFEWGPVTPSGGLLDPTAAMAIAAWSVLALLVVASLLARRRAWRAWAILAGYLIVVDIVPTLLARGRYEDMVGYDPRYVADAALVFAICLAFAFLPAREETEDSGDVYRRRLPLNRVRDVAVTATAAFVLAAGYSTHTFTDTLSGDRVRWYLDTVRASLEGVPEEAGIYSRPVPENIVLPWNGPRRLSHRVLSPLVDGELGERVAEPQQASLAMVFNDDGHLVNAKPAEGSAFFGPPEDEKCIATFGGQAVWGVESLGGETNVLGIGYTAEEETEVATVLGDAWVSASLPEAPDGGTWYVPVDGAGTQIMLHTEEEELCMEWVTFGEMVPATEGNPWEEQEEQDSEDDAGEDEAG